MVFLKKDRSMEIQVVLIAMHELPLHIFFTHKLIQALLLMQLLSESYIFNLLKFLVVFNSIKLPNYYEYKTSKFRQKFIPQ